MAKVLHAVHQIDVAEVSAFWRAYLKGTAALHTRSLIVANVYRDLWLAHDAWITTMQPTLAHEAQATLRGINKGHQALGIELAKVEAALATLSDAPGDVSAVWLGVAMPLAYSPGAITVGITSIGNQLRMLSAPPEIVIEIDGTSIHLMQMATAAGAVAWVDLAAQRYAQKIEPVAAAVGEVISDGLAAGAAAVKTIKNLAESAADAAGWVVPVAIGVGLYVIAKRG